MKLLLSCVNSVVALIGFDLSAGQAFWYCPADRLRACGACYDEDSLLIAGDNFLTRLSAAHGVERVALPGPHENLAHGVHTLESIGIAVADTGNSRVLVFGPDLTPGPSFEPLEGWNAPPVDAVHLNDFARTPLGLVASCFNYRPYRLDTAHGLPWQERGYGLLLSLDKFGGRNVGRVLACDLDCPHSPVWHEDRLYCCASGSGEFLRFAYTPRGALREEARIPVTRDYFLRGALPLGDGSWLLGGSSLRGREDRGMALLPCGANGPARPVRVAAAGEIYDILPWRDEIMRPLTRIINDLPPVYADGENVFPPPLPY